MSGPAYPVFDQTSFSMVLYDLNGRPVRVNKAFEALFGLTLEHVPPNYSVLEDPELERQGALPLVRRAFEGHSVRIGPISYDAPSVVGAGKRTWTYGYFFPIRSATGALEHVGLVHMDLTDQVEVERALRLANERYRALVEATSDMVWNTDAAGMVQDMPVWRELTGQTVDEVRGEGWANALHPDDRERTRAVWWDAYHRRERYDAEYRLRMTDGTYRWMRARAVPIVDDSGAILEWIGTLNDIHDEKTAADRKRFIDEATQLLNETLEWEPTLRALARYCVPRLADYASVDLLDAGGEIRRVETAHVDPARQRTVRDLWERYPYRREEPYGVPEVLRTGQPQFVVEFSWDRVQAFARDAEHLRILRELGPRSYVCVPLIARGKTLGALSLVFSDSGRRYTRADLELAMDLAGRAATAVDNARLYHEAETANRAKAEFLATMSHELRTPLNAIAGHAELLEMGLHGDLNAEQRDAVERIQKSQRHLLALVNDVLNFARIESGTVHYRISDLPLQQVLLDTEAAVRPQLRARNITYRCDTPAADLLVRADHEKLLQILLNVVSNAVKFTEPGGSIDVTVTAREDAVAIAVRDTGRGIPRDKLGVIFEPFVQLDRTLSRSAEGAGLGLAISRDLARAMHGEISADSTPGEGSTFTITMPRAGAPAGTRPKPRKSRPTARP